VNYVVEIDQVQLHFFARGEFVVDQGVRTRGAFVIVERAFRTHVKGAFASVVASRALRSRVMIYRHGHPYKFGLKKLMRMRDGFDLWITWQMVESTVAPVANLVVFAILAKMIFRARISSKKTNPSKVLTTVVGFDFRTYCAHSALIYVFLSFLPR
jgi:hypothetical protein